MSKKLYLSIDRQQWYGKSLQASLSVRDDEGKGHGYRLLGPKYLGDSKLVVEAVLDAYDAEKIRALLDEVFPVEVAAAT